MPERKKIMMKEKWPSCFSIEEPRMNKQILLKRKCCKSTCTSREVRRRHHSPLAIYSLEAAIEKRGKSPNIIMINCMRSKAMVIGCKEMRADGISML
ncbi:hypothetical protein AXF43_25460 [Bacillus paranthracis]|nr:hypothetical protein [Bacillus paranthracis]